jgi:coproporphyrinogen III oxidase
MTTPFFEERNHNAWTISFILPKKFTPEMAPTPYNHSISIQERPAQLTAVVWYTGGNDLDRICEKSAELNSWLQIQRDYNVTGTIKIAKYDSPSILSFFRRNELQVEVAEVH